MILDLIRLGVFFGVEDIERLPYFRNAVFTLHLFPVRGFELEIIYFYSPGCEFVGGGCEKVRNHEDHIGV